MEEKKMKMWWNKPMGHVKYLGPLRMKGYEKPKVNVIYRASVGAGSLGRKLGKDVYKFK
jgi:hypothetical protein